jgi:ATP-dependent DNA ligase
MTDGNTIFRHACTMGLEGVVAKRRDRPYRSGRSPDWIKVKRCSACLRKHLHCQSVTSRAFGDKGLF